MGLSLEVVRKNVDEALRRVEAARVRVGRVDEVRIVAATKYVAPEDMGVVREAGIRVVGETRTDVLLENGDATGTISSFTSLGTFSIARCPRFCRAPA